MKNENLNVKCIYLVPYKIFINHENLCQVTLAGEKPEEVCSLEPQQVLGQAMWAAVTGSFYAKSYHLLL